jgi:hypothetical protein
MNMAMSRYTVSDFTAIRFSGGRTSGYMLRHILDANPTLPEHFKVIFCNTGKEHEATLQFVHEVEQCWCPVVWLEYTYEGGEHGFREVSYCTASRMGEPFDAVIRARSDSYGAPIIPNMMAAFCSSELKTRTGNRYLKSLGWEYWTSIVGLRADEAHRALRIKGDCAAEEVVCPLYAARVGLEDVLTFWKSQPFDLKLPGGDNAYGNCDLCFKKSRARIEKVMLTDPGVADWWIEKERFAGSPFRLDRPTYRQLQSQIRTQGRIWSDAINDETIPCSCTD